MSAKFKNPRNTATQPDPWLLLCSASPADRALKITPTAVRCCLGPWSQGYRQALGLSLTHSADSGCGPTGPRDLPQPGVFQPHYVGKTLNKPLPTSEVGRICAALRARDAGGPQPLPVISHWRGGRPASTAPLLDPRLSLALCYPPGVHPRGGARWHSPAARLWLLPHPALVGCCSPELRLTPWGF